MSWLNSHNKVLQEIQRLVFPYNKEWPNKSFRARESPGALAPGLPPKGVGLKAMGTVRRVPPFRVLTGAWGQENYLQT